jgi:hypothetical protein
MSHPTGARPSPGERPQRVACGCLETVTKIIELCDGCLAAWTELHEQARAAHLATLRERLP